MNLKWAWWENWQSSLDYKLYKEMMTFSSIKQNRQEKFKMDGCDALDTHMTSTTKLDKNEKDKPVNQKLYRGMIGSLLYLTVSRPDIMFATCLCARFQANPKESHLTACKRIFRYLIGTINLGLWYPSYMSFDLITYSDADYVGYGWDLLIFESCLRLMLIFESCLRLMFNFEICLCFEWYLILVYVWFDWMSYFALSFTIISFNYCHDWCQKGGEKYKDLKWILQKGKEINWTKMRYIKYNEQSCF